jgi:hypothetical protein
VLLFGKSAVAGRASLYTLRMNMDRAGGVAWIVASCLSLAIVVFHPTAHDFGTEAQLARASLRMLAVHGGLLATLPLYLFGGLAFVRRAKAGAAFGELGLLVYGLAVVAGLVAAGVSLADPSIARPMLEGDAAARAGYALLFAYSAALIQAFARILVVGSWAAIALFSVAALRSGTCPRALGVYGIAAASVCTALLVAGHLTLSTHGFGLVLLLQAAWFVPAGVTLCRAGA